MLLEQFLYFMFIWGTNFLKCVSEIQSSDVIRLDFQHYFSPSPANHAFPHQKVIKENCIQKTIL